MRAPSRTLTRLVACLGLLTAALLISAEGPRGHAATPVAPAFAPRWLRIDPRDLTSLYLGGSAPCDNGPSGCST